MSTYGPIPIFPSININYPVKVTPVLDTVIGISKSLREMRVAQYVYPLWEIEIGFDELVDQTQNQTKYSPFLGQTEYETLAQFYMSMYGQSNVFGFNCPWDNSRSNQQIGLGDGTTTVFTIYSVWSQSPLASLQPIGLINTVTSVTVGGTTVSPSGYTTERNKITFTSAPAASAAIVMTFSYYYLCKFLEDEQVFEEFSKNRWKVDNLKLRSVYWP